VWTGADTYDLIESEVRATPLEPLSLKGKREAIRAYEVVDILNRPSEDKENAFQLIHEGQSVTNHESYL
jgi:class 3 adenylate cyclase